MRDLDSTSRAAASGRADGASPSGDEPSVVLAARLADLRANVVRHACARRAAGTPVARVLVEMEALVAQAERLQGAFDELGVLGAHVRRWTLAAYADEGDPQGAPDPG